MRTQDDRSSTNTTSTGTANADAADAGDASGDTRAAARVREADDTEDGVQEGRQQRQRQRQRQRREHRRPQPTIRVSTFDDTRLATFPPGLFLSVSVRVCLSVCLSVCLFVLVACFLSPSATLQLPPPLLFAEWFHGKAVLDVGCNVGHTAIEIGECIAGATTLGPF